MPMNFDIVFINEQPLDLVLDFTLVCEKLKAKAKETKRQGKQQRNGGGKPEARKQTFCTPVFGEKLNKLQRTENNYEYTVCVRERLVRTSYFGGITAINSITCTISMIELFGLRERKFIVTHTLTI